ncbi:MAG: phosphoribosylglycinamide formyltransferase [Magnetococcales bacterium]|nr:phosphoribosylglycinamide formyltransferase [Magnetococcales bacterium]NGZ26138.1 phosphoribosylglycinamide formyltransferase [Magnetococcales bacterium]
MAESPYTRDNPLRIGVLISGGGSNLQSLLDHCASGFIPGRISLVISNQADAFGLERARRFGVPTKVVPHSDYPDRLSFDRALISLLNDAQIELVCLAGFMRILTGDFVKFFKGRLLNIHPSLLPSFPGLHVQQKALDAGVRFSGATVHYVDEDVDTGPIIIQAVVPILPDDDASTLSARILKQEHRIYPQAVRLFAQNRLQLTDGKVHILESKINQEDYLLNPPWEG